MKHRPPTGPLGVVLFLLGSMGLTVGAPAQTTASATAEAAPVAPTPDWVLTGNANLFSDYRFRGFTQTGYRPAFQGGVDLSHASGFYIGN